ncbi:torsin-3A isoform X1 [Sorex araneus]|uniref:torsin-3A isoform X1 n=1 Tax=Sorex araneus TaxID=42254 RepID=UPI00243374A4|nr:torsin-3A isoform X1 [Sorex araneus]
MRTGGGALAMARGPGRPLGLCLLLPPLLLLLLLAGAASADAEEPGAGGAGRRWPDMQQRLREAAALCRRYWTLLSCRVWPEDCEEDAARPGWSLPLLGQQYLDILVTWYHRFLEGDGDHINDLSGLETDLRLRLHGQHLARELVPRAVRRHLEQPRPRRALALAFHGGSGTGKNFVAGMLAERLFRAGLRSPCVQVLIATLHFPHPQHLDRYKELLARQIRGTQGRCGQTLFIFDEAEKLHPGLLEALRPHLERQQHGAPGDPDSIFLFLSNLGGSAISDTVLQLLRAGLAREDITLEHLEPRLQAEMAADGGFGQSALVRARLVDLFVPFLPLEAPHVQRCALDACRARGLACGDAALRELAAALVSVPREQPRFSAQGCKSVSQRLSYLSP